MTDGCKDNMHNELMQEFSLNMTVGYYFLPDGQKEYLYEVPFDPKSPEKIISFFKVYP